MISDPVKISKHITIGPQPSEEQLEKLASRGFKTVVNLCKKGELGQQFSPEEEGEKVESLGMHYVHIPVSMNNLKDELVDRFYSELTDSDIPIFVHCRIGQRSGVFGLLYHALRKEITPDQVFKRAEKLGVSPNAPILRSFIESYLNKRAEAVQ